MASRLAVNVISFISSIFLARLLMPEDFGLVALAVGIGAIVTALTALPLSDALIRIDHVEEDHFHSTFTLGFIRSAALALLLVSVAWPAAHFYDDERLIPIMFAIALQALMSGFYSARWPMIQKNLSFGPDAFVGVTVRLVAAISSVLIAYYYRTYWAIVIPIVLMQFLSVAFTHLYAPYRPRFSFKRVPELWSFSIWMTFSSILTAINARFDSLLIGGVLGQRAVGYFSFGDDKAQMPTREVSGSLVRVLFPGLAAVKGDPARLASAYKRIQSLVFALCLPFGIGLALVSDMFVHVLLGEKWLPIIQIMQVLAFALAFENLTIAAAPLAMAAGFTRKLFKYNFIAFGLRLPMVVAGLLLFGIPGLLAARVLATLGSVILYLSLAKRIVHVSVWEQIRGCSRTFLAISSMIICVLLFKAALPPQAVSHVGALCGTMVIGALSYFLSHIALWQIFGRPQGPEAEVFAMLQSAIRKNRHARVD